MQMNAPVPQRDETRESLELITRRLLPAVVKRLLNCETAIAELKSEADGGRPRGPFDPPVAPASTADAPDFPARVDWMASVLADVVAKVDEIDRRTRPRKRTSANVVAKFNRLTASDVAAANHVLRQTSSPDAASKFTGIPLPVVRHIADMDPEDYRQHVLHKRTTSEVHPPEGLTEDDFQTHWTVPLGTSPDAGTDDVLPDSALGSD